VVPVWWPLRPVWINDAVVHANLRAMCTFSWYFWFISSNKCLVAYPLSVGRLGPLERRGGSFKYRSLERSQKVATWLIDSQGAQAWNKGSCQTVVVSGINTHTHAQRNHFTATVTINTSNFLFCVYGEFLFNDFILACFFGFIMIGWFYTLTFS